MKKVLLSFSIVLSLFLTGCFDQPKEPVSPRWDVELNVPLLGKTLPLVDIIDSSSNPNLTIVDSVGVGDSLYLLVVDDLSADAAIQDTLKIPVALAPDTLKINGPAGAGQIRSATIFNPDPDYHLYSAEFKKGNFILDFVNSSASSVNFEMILPGFKQKAAPHDILIISGNLAPGERSNVNVDLGLYDYKELTVFPGFNDMVNYAFQGAPGFYFVGVAEATGPVDLNFTSEINSDEITLSRLSGSIKRTELEYFETEIETGLGNDIKDFDNKVKFQNVAITLRAQTVGEMANLKIELDSTTIFGYKTENGVSSKISQVEFGTEGSRVPYFRSEIIAGTPWVNVLDESNTNIPIFLTKLPDKISVGNKFILDKSTSSPDSLQTISSTDSIKFRADIQAPVILSLKDAAYHDTTEVDLSQDDRDRIMKANSVNVTLEITNSIALGISASATFLDVNHNELFKLKTEAGGTEIVIDPAEVDANGAPITPNSATKIKIVLSKDDIQKFANVQFIRSDFNIKSNGSTSSTYGPYVRVRAKDFIKYKMYGGINYRVDPDNANN